MTLKVTQGHMKWHYWLPTAQLHNYTNEACNTWQYKQ